MGLWGSVRKAVKRYGRAAAGVVTGGASEQVYGIKKVASDVSGYTDMKNAIDDAQNLEAAEAAKLKAEKRAATAEEYAALEDARKRRARIRGRQSTILAGALGAGEPMGLIRKSLLGV